MTSRREKMILSGLAAVTAVGASLLASPDVKADPVHPVIVDNARKVCKALNADNSVQGVARIFTEFAIEEVPDQVFLDSIMYALDVVCPQYQDEVQAAIDYYTPPNGPLLKAI